MNPEKLATRFSTLLAAERELRSSGFRAPAYFAGELGQLERHHETVARELGALIESEGWPDILWVGQEAARDAAKLARLCWSQPRFMRSCIPFMEHGYRFGGVWADWFAKMYDTFMYFENKPQVYGMFLDWDECGQLSPWKIVDEARVDLRRAGIQVSPLRDHVSYVRWSNEKAGAKPPGDLTQYRKARDFWATRREWERKEI